MKIRQSNIQDSEAIWRVHTQSVRELCKTHYSPAQIEAKEKLVSPQSHARSHESQVVFVAEDPEGNIIGFAHLDVPNGGVESVYVHPTYARRGVGRQLMQALEDVARQAGVTELSLDASLNAVPFYEHCGFTAHQQNVYPIHGVASPVVFMTKTLVPKAKAY